MKAQTKAAIASVAVIALALTAVSGVTYSWWTDSESTEIQITTGKFDLGSATIELIDENGDDVLSSASTAGTGSGSSSTISFEVAPPGSADEHSRTYMLMYKTSYMSSAPATVEIKAEATGSDANEWIKDLKVTNISIGSGSTSSSTLTSSNPMSLELDSSTSYTDIVAVIQFEVDLDKAVNTEPAALKIDAELTSRAAA